MSNPELPLTVAASDPAATGFHAARANLYGYNAFQKKLAITENPYPPESSAAKDWVEGWEEARVDDAES